MCLENAKPLKAPFVAGFKLVKPVLSGGFGSCFGHMGVWEVGGEYVADSPPGFHAFPDLDTAERAWVLCPRTKILFVTLSAKSDGPVMRGKQEIQFINHERNQSVSKKTSIFFIVE